MNPVKLLCMIFIAICVPVGLARQGGLDLYGYVWQDSDEVDGPAYNWQDIQGTGYLIEKVENHTYMGPIEFGFAFPFYGQLYKHIYIASDGVVSFVPKDVSCNTGSIPLRDGTENMMAWAWGGLYPQAPSQIYVQNEEDALVIQFENYGHEDGSARAINAQVILYRSGKIRYQYRSFMGGGSCMESFSLKIVMITVFYQV